jgi:hypothetical protein
MQKQARGGISKQSGLARVAIIGSFNPDTLVDAVDWVGDRNGRDHA